MESKMSCFDPLYGVRQFDELSQKYNISFRKADLNQHPDSEWQQFPCRKCVGCRLDKSLEWSLRGMHELRYHNEAMFITLTYNNESLPSDGSLWRIDLQLFMKRLRKFFGKKANGKKKLRVMYCGEYGKSGTNRPHYHLIIFGAQFYDLECIGYNASKWSRLHHQDGYPTYTSKTLSELWPYGFHTIGEVNERTVAYVARYVTKKVYGEMAVDHYGDRVPEFFGSSNRPGIGYQWFTDFHNDLLKGFITHDGKQRQIPIYYLRKLQDEYPDLYLELEASKELKKIYKLDKELEECEEDRKLSGEEFLELLRWRFLRNDVKKRLKLKQTADLKRHYEED